MAYAIVLETIGIFTVAAFLFGVGEKFECDFLIFSMGLGELMILTIYAFTICRTCVSHFEADAIVLLALGLVTIATFGVGTCRG